MVSRVDHMYAIYTRYYKVILNGFIPSLKGKKWWQLSPRNYLPWNWKQSDSIEEGSGNQYKTFWFSLAVSTNSDFSRDFCKEIKRHIVHHCMDHGRLSLFWCKTYWNLPSTLDYDKDPKPRYRSLCSHCSIFSFSSC